MNRLLKNKNYAKRTIISGWIFFFISLLTTLLLTAALFGYSFLPETIEGDFGDGTFGTLSLDLIHPALWEMVYDLFALIFITAFFSLFFFLFFWFRWFKNFCKARKYTQISPTISAVISLIPCFGILFHYFTLKDALFLLTQELNKKEIAVTEKLPNAFILCFINGIAAILFCFLPIFNYWISVFFAETICFFAMFRYLRLIKLIAKEEEKLFLYSENENSKQTE